MKRHWRFFRKLGTEAQVAGYLYTVAAVYGSCGQYNKAGEYFDEALAICRKLGKDAEFAAYLNNVGSVYDSWAQHEKAIKSYEKALAI